MIPLLMSSRHYGAGRGVTRLRERDAAVKKW